jgi:glycosyltransferase involved in cell wall biosynthesis
MEPGAQRDLIARRPQQAARLAERCTTSHSMRRRSSARSAAASSRSGGPRSRFLKTGATLVLSRSRVRKGLALDSLKKYHAPSKQGTKFIVENVPGISKLNVLIVGHACLPGAGSELGVTWNWAWHLAARNRVWVITHGHFRQLIERFMHDNPCPNLRFVWVGPLGWWDPWNGVEPGGIRLHYLMWRRAVVTAAKRLIAAEQIDLIHHVSWTTLSAPPLLWQIGKPFVWGPIGGGQTLPGRFLTSLGRDAASELLRTLRVSIMPWMPSLRRTVARTDLMLAANDETAAVLRRAGARQISLLPDVGVVPSLLQLPTAERASGAGLIILWASRFENFKGLAICLDVAKTVRTLGVRFLIAGWGRQQGWAQRYARNFGLHDRVTFLGRLSWEDLQQRFTEADLFLFTSLRDTLGAVVFEAMAKGCPVMCLNHNGAATHLPADAAIKVPVTTPRRVVKELACQIEALASDRARLRLMSEAAYRFTTTQQWDRRATLMEKLYRQVLTRHAAHSVAAGIVGTRYAHTLD